jgi:tetratricopeptide (TPR) repeat protein
MNFKQLKSTILKSKFIYALPILIGMGIGLFFLEKPKSAESSELSPISTNNSLTQQPENMGVKKTKSTSTSTIEQHIITAQSLLTKAIELSKEKDQTNNDRIVELVNQAIDATNQAISLNPNDPRGYAQRAKIYQTISQYMPEANDQAINNWKKAIELNPTNSDYCQKLANLLLASNKTENMKSAVYYLQQAVDANPTDPNLLKKLAEVKAKAGYIHDARDDYQQLIGLLTQKDQKETIKAEIDSLNRLLAETAKTQQISESLGNTKPSPEQQQEITLPDSPPKLQAHHLASSNTVIAAPEEKKSTINSQQLNSNALSGTGTIKQGEKKVKICNNNLSPQTQVYLTPETKTNQILFVKSKAPYNPETEECAHFVAATAKPVSQNLEFRWLIIEN